MPLDILAVFALSVCGKAVLSATKYLDKPKCHYCKTRNEEKSLYCESCGKGLTVETNPELQHILDQQKQDELKAQQDKAEKTAKKAAHRAEQKKQKEQQRIKSEEETLCSILMCPICLQESLTDARFCAKCGSELRALTPSEQKAMLLKYQRKGR